MYLETVWIRFYKSFNFDYLRKYNAKTEAPEWEKIDGRWFPYIRIPIDPEVTTIVGANESGKTHLLTAVEKAVGISEIAREDFCRYSSFFTVEYGKMRWPDFGLGWAGVTDEERRNVLEACGIAEDISFNSFRIFRNDRDRLTVYLQKQDEWVAYPAKNAAKLLPRVFRLDVDVALPESVPIRCLTEATGEESAYERVGRKRRIRLFDSILPNLGDWFATKENVTKSAEPIATAMNEFCGTGDATATQSGSREVALARDLMLKIANIDPEALKELLHALEEGHDAFANSIKDQINRALAEKLNFPHWWVQDRQFRLLVSPRDYDLVFTIQDRTGTEYAFSERSNGLRYFLSYYIQYLAYASSGTGTEILLMDEPDAYLSQQGQQDLLKIFHSFANPTTSRPAVQVVYVTHSPFLIDRNHSERIRVLEKGVGDEGTRVVRDASRNHYEPLRSAFGSFVGETTFIGNCNLMVEGASDQILLAGATTHLRMRGAGDLQSLDLNRITIVPAGGTSHIPYLVYLARGRGSDRPAVIVLLDSDDAGREAKKRIQRDDVRHKQLLKPEYILQIGELDPQTTAVRTSTGACPIEIEDLLPMQICLDATKRYLAEVCGAPEETVEAITEAELLSHAGEGKSIIAMIQELASDLGEDLHVEKTGFARAANQAVEQLQEATASDDHDNEALGQYELNMRCLFERLSQMQRNAERELTAERVTRKVGRAKAAFIQDFPEMARREQALLALEDIEAALDDTRESDMIRGEIQSIRRDFRLSEDVQTHIPEYGAFKERLLRLEYVPVLSAEEQEQQGQSDIRPPTVTPPPEQPAAPPVADEASPVTGRQPAVGDASE